MQDAFHQREKEEAITLLGEQKEIITALMIKEPHKIKKLRQQKLHLLETVKGLQGKNEKLNQSNQDLKNAIEPQKALQEKMLEEVIQLKIELKVKEEQKRQRDEECALVVAENEKLKERNHDLQNSVDSEKKSQVELLEELTKIKIEVTEKEKQGREKDEAYALVVAEIEMLKERNHDLQNCVDSEKKSQVEFLEEMTKIKIEMKELEEKRMQRDEEYDLVVAESSRNTAEIDKCKEMLSCKDVMIDDLEEKLQALSYEYRQTIVDMAAKEKDLSSKVIEAEKLKRGVQSELLRAKEEIQGYRSEIEKLESEIEKCESDYCQQLKEIQELSILHTKLSEEKEGILTVNKRLLTANKELLSTMQQNVLKFDNKVESMAQDVLKIGQKCLEKEKANEILIAKFKELQSKLDFVMNELSKFQEKKRKTFISFFRRYKKN